MVLYSCIDVLNSLPGFNIGKDENETHCEVWMSCVAGSGTVPGYGHSS